MTDWRALAENTLAEFTANPVTLNEPTGPASEVAYLRNLGASHVDTVIRVGQHIDKLGLRAPQVLEMGAYFGVVSVALARGGIQVTAQDVNGVMNLSALTERYRREGVGIRKVDDVSKVLPYGDSTFDTLICCEMLEHLPFNILRLVREMRRIVKPDGFAFLTVPNQASAKRRLDLLCGRPIREKISDWIASPEDDNWHWHEWIGSEFQLLLEAGGFQHITLDFRHFVAPSHPNRFRRALVNLMYFLWPSLKDDIHVFAS